MSWLREIMHALHYEPETRLAYFQGCAFHKLGAVNCRKPRYVGIFLRLGVYSWRLLKSLRIHKCKGSDRSVDIFAFAQTANQANSLATTIEELRNRNLIVHCVTAEGGASVSNQFSDDKCQQMTLSPMDVIKLVLLTIFRLPSILQQLAGKDRRIAKWHIDSFLYCHVYLIVFEKMIKSTTPRLILMSNDHNAAQRCLLALALVKGVKTAYIQHASVSHIFPSLCFDYSFLDGQIAADTYRQCECNRPMRAPLSPKQRHLFLTGQKKPILRAQGISSGAIGLAINTLDGAQHVIRLVKRIAQAGHALRLRWHPALSSNQIDEIWEACSGIPSVEFSDPILEPVGVFLAQVSVLIAANSSIHLEAAVAGVVPIYFEVSPVSKRDYYGYVKNGVSASAKDTDSLLHLITGVLGGRRELNLRAIQKYSATFNTRWEGREGELAATIIKKLLEDSDPSNCWGYAGAIGPNLRRSRGFF